MSYHQCPSCGGFCKKSGCERANVKPDLQLTDEQISKESIKKLLADGWVNPAKRQENKQLGVKNYNFAGFYNTPAGVFESLHQAAVANNCSDKTVKVRCRGNVCIVKSVKYVYQPKPGWSFSPKESA